MLRTPEKLTEILYLAENLKKIPDTVGFQTAGERALPSIAGDFCCLLILKDEFPNVDMDKVIMMCIFSYDLGEAFYETLSFRHFIRRAVDEEIEKHKLCEWLNTSTAPL